MALDHGRRADDQNVLVGDSMNQNENPEAFDPLSMIKKTIDGAIGH